MKHSALIAIFLACGVLPCGAEEEKLAYAISEGPEKSYTDYIPNGSTRENPIEARMPISLSICKILSGRNDFSSHTFESDALRKLDRFGLAGLDIHDRKWISAHDNRKAACAALFKANGGGSYLDQAKAWLRERLSE